MRTHLKKLSTKELESLKLISDYELTIFNFEKILEISELNRYKLQDILTIYTQKGILSRIEKGLYCIRNFRNPYVIGNFIVKNGSIAYWSALNIHGLTEQISNVVYVQSEYRKNDKKIFNTQYKFIKVKPSKISGIIQMGYGNEQFNVTNVEKTLFDCFDLPQYSGGYEELIRAFYKAKINTTKLLELVKNTGNLSVLKRMAFLSELYEMKGFTKFQNEVLKMMNVKYTIIDPFGENTGEFNSKWRIRLNISKENLLQIIQKTY